MKRIEARKCPVCSSRNFSHSFKGYKKCTDCQAMFASKFPYIKEMQKRADMWGKRYVKSAKQDSVTPTEQERIQYLLKKGGMRKKELIDVGCGNGNFLKYAQDQGFAVSGMDISRPIVKYLHKRGITMYTSLKKIDKKYSFVTSFDVIEHTDDPKLFVKEVKRILRKEGVLLLTTPNAGGISARLLKKKWWVFGTDDHLIMFYPSTLKKLLQVHGFVVKEVKTDIITQWFVTKNTIFSRILDKMVYVLLLPFQKEIFKRNLGDNIQILAKKSS